MNPDFSQIDIYKVLIWVIIVLIAGFIGQFGKSFAKHLIERFRKKPAPPAPPEHVPAYRIPEGPPGREKDSISPAGTGTSKEEAKARKKELKAEIKRSKKEAKD